MNSEMKKKILEILLKELEMYFYEMLVLLGIVMKRKYMGWSFLVRVIFEFGSC